MIFLRILQCLRVGWWILVSTSMIQDTSKSSNLSRNRLKNGLATGYMYKLSAQRSQSRHSIISWPPSFQLLQLSTSPIPCEATHFYMNLGKHGAGKACQEIYPQPLWTNQDSMESHRAHLVTMFCIGTKWRRTRVKKLSLENLQKTLHDGFSVKQGYV